MGGEPHPRGGGVIFNDFIKYKSSKAYKKNSTSTNPLWKTATEQLNPGAFSNGYSNWSRFCSCVLYVLKDDHSFGLKPESPFSSSKEKAVPAQRRMRMMTKQLTAGDGKVAGITPEAVNACLATLNLLYQHPHDFDRFMKIAVEMNEVNQIRSYALRKEKQFEYCLDPALQERWEDIIQHCDEQLERIFREEKDFLDLYTAP